MSEMPSTEVANVIRGALAGAIPVRGIDAIGPWERLGGYDVRFAFGDWELSIFNDGGGVDYIDRAVAPDGRVGDYDTWGAEAGAGWACPLRHLEPREVAALDALLARATQMAGCLTP